jgi:hypothetical protein
VDLDSLPVTPDGIHFYPGKLHLLAQKGQVAPLKEELEARGYEILRELRSLGVVDIRVPTGEELEVISTLEDELSGMLSSASVSYACDAFQRPT